IEFTIQEGTLYLLQTRSGQRSAAAAVRVGVDLVRESVIDEHTALLRVRPQDLHQMLHPVFDAADKAAAIARGRLLARGLPAAPGAAVGKVVFDADRAVEWADKYRSLGVRANADTPEDARKAREFGAEGIGLVRTEHMFFAAERIPIVREMIMAPDAATRHAAVKKLEPFQRQDFVGIFRAMDGLPVTIRLLDPPLHEFLTTPKEYKEMIEERVR